MSQSLRLLTVQLLIIDSDADEQEYNHDSIIATIENAFVEEDQVVMVDWEIGPAKVVVSA